MTSWPPTRWSTGSTRWMDSRFIETRVFGEPTHEEYQRPALWRLWRSLPPKGRAAIFVGGLMRAAAQRRRRDRRTGFSTWLRHIAQPAGRAGRRRCADPEVLPAHPGPGAKKKLKEAEKNGIRLAGRPPGLGRVGRPRRAADRRADPARDQPAGGAVDHRRGHRRPLPRPDRRPDRPRGDQRPRRHPASTAAWNCPRRCSTTSTPRPNVLSGIDLTRNWTATPTASSWPNSKGG